MDRPAYFLSKALENATWNTNWRTLSTVSTGIIHCHMNSHWCAWSHPLGQVDECMCVMHWHLHTHSHTVTFRYIHTRIHTYTRATSNTFSHTQYSDTHTHHYQEPDRTRLAFWWTQAPPSAFTMWRCHCPHCCWVQKSAMQSCSHYLLFTPTHHFTELTYHVCKQQV